MDGARHNAPLGAVFPLLLYTGKATWNAATSVEQLIQTELPRQFIPRLSYHPILVNEIPYDSLVRIHNAVAAAFYAENRDALTFTATLDELMAILSEEAPEHVEIFARWLASYLSGTTGRQIVVGTIRSVGALRTMIDTNIEQYEKKLRDEGREQEKRETARALKEQGVAVEVIARATGLSEQEIQAL